MSVFVCEKSVEVTPKNENPGMHGGSLPFWRRGLFPSFPFPAPQPYLLTDKHITYRKTKEWEQRWESTLAAFRAKTKQGGKTHEPKSNQSVGSKPCIDQADEIVCRVEHAEDNPHGEKSVAASPDFVFSASTLASPLLSRNPILMYD